MDEKGASCKYDQCDEEHLMMVKGTWIDYEAVMA